MRISRMIGFGIVNARTAKSEEPDEPHPRRERRHRTAAVQRRDRQRLKRFRKKPVKASALKSSFPVAE
jgi:hypothetical protein